jgi:Brp/Blh family beta-carotene 15,15'-monooxygenase
MQAAARSPAPRARQPVCNNETWSAPAGQVSPLFWPLAVLACGCGMGSRFGWWAIDSAPVTATAIAVMLIGGLPHGACDMALAATAWRTGRRLMAALVTAYIGVAAAMAMLWWLAPVLALLVFLALAALHFGEDWAMLPAGLLRLMAGLAVIATAALGAPQAVAALFTAMTASPLGTPIAAWAAAMAPMTLLVTLVGLILAWQAGHRAWVMAHTMSYACLLTLPPLIGFGVFFVGLHAPLHWRQVVRALPPMRHGAAKRQGAGLTVLVLAIWLGALWGKGLLMARPATLLLVGGDAFCLLSIVAAPHLALSLALERHVRRPGHG